MAARDEKLRRAEVLGLAGVILHPGAYTTGTERDSLQRIADDLAAVFARRLETIIGFDRLKVFHLNDSKKPLGS